MTKEKEALIDLYSIARAYVVVYSNNKEEEVEKVENCYKVLEQFINKKDIRNYDK